MYSIGYNTFSRQNPVSHDQYYDSPTPTDMYWQNQMPTPSYMNSPQMYYNTSPVDLGDDNGMFFLGGNPYDNGEMTNSFFGGNPYNTGGMKHMPYPPIPTQETKQFNYLSDAKGHYNATDLQTLIKNQLGLDYTKEDITKFFNLKADSPITDFDIFTKLDASGMRRMPGSHNGILSDREVMTSIPKTRTQPPFPYGDGWGNGSLGGFPPIQIMIGGMSGMPYTQQLPQFMLDLLLNGGRGIPSRGMMPQGGYFAPTPEGNYPYPTIR